MNEKQQGSLDAAKSMNGLCEKANKCAIAANSISKQIRKSF